MVVGSDPANPNTRGLLASKDPHRIVILKMDLANTEERKLSKVKNKSELTVG